MDQDISPCNCKGNCPLLCWTTGEYCFTIGYHGTVRLLLVRVSPKMPLYLVCFQVYFGHYLRHIDWLVHPPKHFKLARKMPTSAVCRFTAMVQKRVTLLRGLGAMSGRVGMLFVVFSHY